MSFKEFTANILSVRDYKETPLNEKTIADVAAYLEEINVSAGREKGFSLIMLEEGHEVFNKLEGVGGYSGIMIKGPHYIGLAVSKEAPETEFYGAYYMQSIVKKLYEMKLGSCWINIRGIAEDIKSALPKSNLGSIYYLLAFGQPDEKAIKQKTPHATVTGTTASYKQDPYGIKLNEPTSSDIARNSLEEIVYLYEWGKKATYEDLESRGMTDIFFYVRNAPSYKNLQPCRLILKDGETELAVQNPISEGSYIDAGIMMYILAGLAKDLGLPGKWQFVMDGLKDKDYSIIAKIEL